MRYLTGLFSLLFTLSAHAEDAPEAPAFVPPKVSELNANLFQYLSTFIKDVWVSVRDGFASLEDFTQTAQWFGDAIKSTALQNQVGEFLFEFGISLVLAVSIERMMSWWSMPKTHVWFTHGKHRGLRKFFDLMMGIALALLPLCVYGAVLYGTFQILDPVAEVYLNILQIFLSGLIPMWGIIRISRLFLCPHSVHQQHIPLNLETMAHTYRWIRISGIAALLGYYIIEIGELIGSPPAGHKFLWQSTGFVFALLTIYWMGVLRHDVMEWVTVQTAKTPMSRFRKAMSPYLYYGYYPTILLIIMSYVTWVTKDFAEFQWILWKSLGTLCLFPFLRYVAYGLRWARVVYMRDHARERGNPLPQNLLFYGRQMDFLAIVVLNLVAIMTALDLWGIGPLTFVQTPMGKMVAEKVLSILIIFFLALFLQKAGNGILTKYLSFQGVLGTVKIQKENQARLETLSRVLRNFLRILIWGPALLFTLTELDIDVWPALVAIGPLAFGLTFGFQEVVKDFVAGFFMLLENTFSIGDIVTINGQMGTVESMSIRTLRLRAMNGDLYTFRFGQMTSIANATREFSVVVLTVSVGHEADVDQVFELIHETDKLLLKNKAYKSLVKSHVIVDGITDMDDHSMEIRARIKTGPADRFAVSRMFNKILQEKLRAAGVPMGIPYVFNYNEEIRKIST